MKEPALRTIIELIDNTSYIVADDLDDLSNRIFNIDNHFIRVVTGEVGDMIINKTIIAKVYEIIMEGENHA